jgi:hypothetical protein
MNTTGFLRGLLIFLLAALSPGAIMGGLLLIIEPQGSHLSLSVALLSSSPFNDFLIPGIVLLSLFGLSPIYIIYALIKKPENHFLQNFNLLNDHHFSWAFAIYTGLGQIIWIHLQTVMIKTVLPIHTVFTFLGLLIVCVALLPKLRESYRLR